MYLYLLLTVLFGFGKILKYKNIFLMILILVFPLILAGYKFGKRILVYANLSSLIFMHYSVFILPNISVKSFFDSLPADFFRIKGMIVPSLFLLVFLITEYWRSNTDKKDMNIGIIL